MEKFHEKRREMWAVFVDLEKAFDRVPHELIWWALRKRDVKENVVRAVQDMYQGATTSVRTPCGNTRDFEVKVGVHQGSSLSPFIFIVILDALSENINSEAPWNLLFADDLAIVQRSN